MRLLVSVILTGLMMINTGAMIFAAEASNAAEEVSDENKPPKPVVPEGLRKDRALAEQLIDSEAKWLTAGKTQFLGIYNADSSGEARGSLLILATPGSTSVTPGVLPMLATELSSKGWNTLGISLPELDFSPPAPKHPKAETAESAAAETTETTDAGITTSKKENEPSLPKANEWYAKQATTNMEKMLERLMAAEVELLATAGQYVLVAQGVSAELVLELISSKVIKPSGLICLNIQHPVQQRLTKIPANLAAVKIPILDIYRVSNAKAAKKRKNRQRNANYQQLFIPGNGIHFRGSEQLVIRRLQGWLKNNM